MLGWSAAEAGAELGGSVASINSVLQRARETLAKRYSAGPPMAPSRPTLAQQNLLDRYLRAWEGHDLDGFAALLKEDATCVMPPWPQWFSTRQAIGAFFATAWKTCHGLRLVPTRANGEPAFAVYELSEDGRFAAHSLHLITLQDDGIFGMTLFIPPAGPRLFPAFGLPLVLADDAGG